MLNPEQRRAIRDLLETGALEEIIKVLRERALAKLLDRNNNAKTTAGYIDRVRREIGELEDLRGALRQHGQSEESSTEV